MTPEYSSLSMGATTEERPQLPSAPEKAESVITGKATIKKRTGKSLRNFILAQDFRDIKAGVVEEIVRPRIKDIIYDIFKGVLNTADSGLQLMIYGEERRAPNRVGDKVSYNQFSSRRSTPVSSAPSMSSVIDCNDITFESRGDAEAVLESMYDYLRTYGCVTVAQMYDFSNQSIPYTANNYGWTDLTGTTINRCFDGGYIINLPRAKPMPR